MTQIGTVELLATINTAKYKRGAEEIKDANEDIQTSAGRAGDSGSRLGDKLNTLAKRGIKTASVGMLALAGAIGTMTIRGGIDRALNIEDAQAKLRGLGHDAESITDIMDSALASVKGTAYGLDAAATAAAGAVAAGVKPGKDLTRYLGTAADAATIAGVSFNEMGSIFGKVQTQQRAYTMELNQLADRGIPIYEWLQEELGVTQEALREMVAKGEVDSETYFKVIRDNIGGAALESGKTTRGAWANLRAAMSRIGARIVSGPIDNLRKGFGDLTDWIDDNADEIVETVQKAMRIMEMSLKATLGVIRDYGPIILRVASMWAAYRTAVIAVNTVQKLQTMYAAATATQYMLLNGSLITVRTATIAQTVAQAGLNTVMKLSPIGLLTGAVVGITTAYMAATSQTDRTKDASNRLKDARIQLKDATDAAKDAEDRLKDAQLGAEGAALRVEGAQKRYNDALRDYGPDSYEARLAAYDLKLAQDDLAKANDAVKDAANDSRDAQTKIKDVKRTIIETNAEIAASASNVAGNYQNLTSRVQDAQKEMSKSPTRTGVTPMQNLLPNLNNRAAGGPVQAGRPYLVGENRDGSLNDTTELFVPNRSGRIINSKDLQSAIGGGNSVEYNINQITIASEVDGERWLRRLTGDQEIVSNGLVPRQAYM